MKVCKEKVKRCIYQSIKEVNEQSGRKMNEDVDEKLKLFWNEVNKMSGRKVKLQ